MCIKQCEFHFQLSRNSTCQNYPPCQMSDCNASAWHLKCFFFLHKTNFLWLSDGGIAIKGFLQRLPTMWLQRGGVFIKGTVCFQSYSADGGHSSCFFLRLSRPYNAWFCLFPTILFLSCCFLSPESILFWYPLHLQSLPFTEPLPPWGENLMAVPYSTK